ncbi:lysozyme-like protein [Linderina pennispora]|uniref:Lysozyme-like protein n=1 Tax=Linderina pennispora TaxID=61395 RepID=A0A1Y1WCP5_9FUNG|nr:lysozyme-like protein [Linderina pennispora]ORX71313.1 lysozyme-like protein [Linderina pennispora]
MAFPNGSYDPNKTVYFGRGYLQLTWAYNYGPASLDLLGNLDLLIHPERVANEPDLSWGTAFWYWKAKLHSAAGVTKGQFGASINAINGDLECSKVNNESAKSRLEIYKKLLGKYAPTIKVDTAGCKGLERL